MNKRCFLEALIVLMFLASLNIGSVMAGIPVEETKRDPTTGYDPAPGESFSWVYQYGVYNTQTKEYSNIIQSHDYGWVSGTGTYSPYSPQSDDEYHPWVQTYVLYWYDGEWIVDTFAEIAW